MVIIIQHGNLSLLFIHFFQEAGFAESPPPAYDASMAGAPVMTNQAPPTYSATAPASDMGE